MAIRTKTVEYAFETYLDKLAITNIFGTTARHDFSSLDIEIPETTSRVFRSCLLIITWSDAFTSGHTIQNLRMGITIGGITNDADFQTGAIGTTSNVEGGYFVRDVTAEFASNFGAGTTQTVYPSFALTAATTSTFITNVAAKLIITYDFNDSGATTLLKTVKIGIQSSTASFAAGLSTVGDSGGSPATDDAIPALDTFLPEASKSFKRAWLEVVGNDAGITGNTTSYALTATFGSGSQIIRSNITRSLTGGGHFTDYITYDLTGSYPTSASQGLKLGAGISSRFIVSLALCVTYTYNPTLSSSSINFCELTLNGLEPGYNLPGNSLSPHVYTNYIMINEPGPIKLERSTVNFYLHAPTTAVVSMSLGTQQYRGYTIPTTQMSSPFMVSQRADINSGWSLTRGMNLLKSSIFATANRAASCTGGKIYLLYTSSIAPSGTETHNKTIHTSLANLSTSASLTSTLVYTASGPSIPENQWYINQVGIVATNRTPGLTGGHLFTAVGPQVMSSDTFASGTRTYCISTLWDTELGTSFFTYDMTDIFNQTSYQTGSLVLSTNRNWRYDSPTTTNFQSWMYVTYNSIVFPISGTILSSAGGTVNIKVYQLDKQIASGSRTGNGTYSINVFNPTELLVVTARESSDLVGSSDQGAASP